MTEAGRRARATDRIQETARLTAERPGRGCTQETSQEDAGKGSHTAHPEPLSKTDRG